MFHVEHPQDRPALFALMFHVKHQAERARLNSVVS